MISTWLRRAALAALALVLLAILAGALARPLAAARIHALAHARGLQASWSRLEIGWPARARIRDLALRRAAGDTVLAARDVQASLGFLPLLVGRARFAEVTLADVRVDLPAGGGALADTLAPREEVAGRAVAARVRRGADALVRALLAPARTLPELHLRDVAVSRGGAPRVTLDALDLEHEPAAERLLAAGTLHGEGEVPFDLLLRWQHDDRLTGRAEFRVQGAEPPAGPAPAGAPSLVVVLDGRVAQDRHARTVRIAPGTKLTVGSLAAEVTGAVSARGPRFTLDVDAEHLTAADFRRSLPGAVLGPLAGLELSGSFDWHGGFDLDLSRPDSVRFRADVVPHGLALDPATSRPSLQALAGPFTADIHLPHDRIVQRTLSDANPHYCPLDRVSSYLRDAVVTNEDGGFWRHRGFNPEAISLALAADLRAGAYKRGAGTITMQLARNLWLGHRRTLSRKAQEVALAWLLEHESGLGKDRLLEIYLNIIEWGPDVHGADEAAHYYFSEDAAQVTLPEALFLTIVVPSPGKWRWRFSPDGTLRPFARAQMHFIAGKMSARGWLDPGLVPPADSLRVTLRGPARALFAIPDTAATAADSLAAEPN